MNHSADSELTPVKRFFMWLVGPAIIMTAGIMGAGSTVSLLSAGTYFKYALLWAALLSLPAVIVAQDTAARFGAAGGIGTMQLIDRETFIGLKWIILIPALLAAILANMNVGEADVIRLSKELKQMGLTTIIITLGANGAFYSHDDIEKHIEGYRMNAIATTAAGDVFNG